MVAFHSFPPEHGLAIYEAGSVNVHRAAVVACLDQLVLKDQAMLSNI